MANQVDAEVRLYDRLFTTPHPDKVEEGGDFTANLNPRSLEILNSCKVEPGLADGFDPSAYFKRSIFPTFLDPLDVFNR